MYSEREIVPDDAATEAPLLAYPSRTTGLLVTSTLYGVLAAFQFGFATSVLNQPEKRVRADINASPFEYSVAVSVFALSGLMGAFVAGGLADRWGRRQFLLLNTIPFAAAGALGALSVNPAMLIASRFIVGAGCGAATGARRRAARAGAVSRGRHRAQWSCRCTSRRSRRST